PDGGRSRRWGRLAAHRGRRPPRRRRPVGRARPAGRGGGDRRGEGVAGGRRAIAGHPSGGGGGGGVEAAGRRVGGPGGGVGGTGRSVGTADPAVSGRPGHRHPFAVGGPEGAGPGGRPAADAVGEGPPDRPAVATPSPPTASWWCRRRPPGPGR